MHDLVIRNGKVYDGSGKEAFQGDIAVDAGIISIVGEVPGAGKEEIDASGHIVTPGFVDAHTHFDGQATWDPLLAPSTYHGVTTVVMGNCGVGFAPCKPEQRDWLISLMEGVEEIPGTALHEGIQWDWETFPEYLDALDRRQLAIDVGTQVPHGAVRAYVMGERGAKHEPAEPKEIEDMARIVCDAIDAGALGFSTSRTEKHKDSSGNLTPSIDTREEELVEIAKAMGSLNKGVLQGISDFYNFEGEFSIFRHMVEASGRPMSITVEQQDSRPDHWKTLLRAIEDAQTQGLPIKGQVPPRATGVLLGLTTSIQPLQLYPSWNKLVETSLEDKVAALRDPEFRAQILRETPIDTGIPLVQEILTGFQKMFPLGDPVNYEPDPGMSIAAQADRLGASPLELVMDMMAENGGRALMYQPIFNYLPGNLDYVEEMLLHPHTVFGLSDGGAHCTTICDSSFPTTLIQHWGRDRTRGKRIALEKLVAMQTSETAKLVGLLDRGLLMPGYKADINVIDFDNLRLHKPFIVNDLPANGARLVQKATGYSATIVSGVVAFRNGEPTGALNGQLIRGEQAIPQD